MILIASKTARYNSIAIHQDATFTPAKLKEGGVINHDVARGRGVWIQMIEGELSINNEKTIYTGDGQLSKMSII